MRMLRITMAWVAGGVLLWLALCAATGVVATENALHPQKRHLADADRTSAHSLAIGFHAVLQDVSIRAQDGVILQAWAIRPEPWNGDAVILLHGQADNRAGMLGQAEMLLLHGYAVLLPDARAHGESGGAIATYGVLEADDVRRWFEWLQNNEQPRCIDGVG